MSTPFEQDGVVTALRYDEAAVAGDIAAWCGGELEQAEDGTAPATIWVPTAKGPRPAALGDWVVRRPAGDYYTCDPTEFAALHDPLL